MIKLTCLLLPLRCVSIILLDSNNSLVVTGEEVLEENDDDGMSNLMSWARNKGSVINAKIETKNKQSKNKLIIAS